MSNNDLSENIDVKDYGLFTDGITVVQNTSEEIEIEQSNIKSYKEKLGDSSIFKGPISDSCVDALDKADKKIVAILENLGLVKNYLSNTSTTYNDADKKSCEIIKFNIDNGKMEVKKGVFGSEYKNPANISGSKLNFIEIIKDYAIESYLETGVLPSLTIAQAIHESRWGDDSIDNNLYGIKTGSNWTGQTKSALTTEYDNSGAYNKVDTFRAYKPERQEGESDEEYRNRCWYLSTMDHGEFLKDREWYAKVLTAKDYKEACYEVKKAGYATGPKYAEHLIETVEKYGLDQWDPTPEERAKELATRKA